MLFAILSSIDDESNVMDIDSRIVDHDKNTFEETVRRIRKRRKVKKVKTFMVGKYMSKFQ